MTGSVPSRPTGYDDCNIYTTVIIDEALRRGIEVEVVDAGRGELLLSSGCRTIRTMESLSELTSAIAFKRCDHKGLTREVLTEAGLSVPPGQLATFGPDDETFLKEWGDIVVKPAKGEQGWGITVGVTTVDELGVALEAARLICPEVLLEQRVEGEDLRIIVIAGEVVAASVRRPPTIVGDGSRTVEELIAALDGPIAVELDEQTITVVESQGYTVETVLSVDVRVPVRRTANVHTGGSITDVTDELSSTLAEVAVKAAEAIEIPVVGLDLMVPDIAGQEYVIIEANEQPGLANHDPRPTAERFVELLLPSD